MQPLPHLNGTTWELLKYSPRNSLFPQHTTGLRIIHDRQAHVTPFCKWQKYKMLKLELFKSAPKSQDFVQTQWEPTKHILMKEQLPYLMPAGQSLLGEVISPSLVFLTTLNLVMSGDICICSHSLESIICVSHISEEGKGKSTRCPSKENETDIESLPTSHSLGLFHDRSVFHHAKFFKPSSHTFLQVQVSHLQFPGHTHLFLRQALPEKLVLIYFWSEYLSSNGSCGK